MALVITSDGIAVDLDDFQPVRISTFSAWGKPHHDVAWSSVELGTLVSFAKEDQLGIVLTDPDGEEPGDWRGPGIDDRR